MIADKLRDLRKKRNLTQRELADALNVSPTYISKIERGKTRPGAQFVKNCAYVFGIRDDELQRSPTVTRHADGFLSVCVDGAITPEQAIELARELMRVATGGTDEPCARCGERPRMWVQGVHCSSCTVESLREALRGCALDDVCENPHDGCGAGCDGYG